MQHDPTRTKILIKGFARQLRRLFTSFQNQSLRRIQLAILTNKNRLENTATLNKKKLIMDSVVTDIQRIIDETEYTEITNRLRPIIRRHGRIVYDKGARKGIADINKIPNTEAEFFITRTDMEALDAMLDHNFALVKCCSNNMKKELLRVISTGMLEGQGIVKISKAIRERITMTKRRADMIARTETIRNYNQASLNKYKQHGIRKWRWLTALDERTCDTCAPLDGQTFNFGSPQPPIHPSCRCAVAPFIDKSTTPLIRWR